MQSIDTPNKLPIYEKAIVKPDILLPPSRLYHLEPLGLGTPDVECLTSYFSRLAEAHLLTPFQLFAQIVGPLTRKIRTQDSGIDPSPNKHWSNYLPYSHPLNGRTWRTVLWIKALEELTLYQGLQFLTLLPWGEVLKQSASLRQFKAWCPCCYEQLRQNGSAVYEPLLWALNVVTVCPLHQCELQQACPNCRRRLPVLSGYLRVGYCTRCQTWLGHDVKKEGVIELKDFEYQLWVAENVREWIGAALSLPSPPSREDISRIIRLCVNRWAGGNNSAFAQLINVSDTAVYRWLLGSHQPPMSDILKICHIAGISLSKLLTRSFERFSQSESLPAEQTHAVLSIRTNNKAKLKQALEAALNEEPPPSVSEVAARFNYKQPAFLYIMFSELCRKLTKKRKAYGGWSRSRSVEITEKQWIKIHAAMEAALKQEVPPPLTHIAETFGFKSDNRLRYRFPSLCRQIVIKRARREHLELQLGEVLQETPPPSIDEVTVRFNYKEHSLSYYFPELCAAIRQRHTTWIAARKDEASGKLLEELTKNPPPLLAEVAKRQNCSLSALNRRYPEICRSITMRRRDYKQQAKIERLHAHKEEVRNIVAGLIDRGLYPSAPRVRPLLKNPGNPGFVALTNVLRELRQERDLQDG